MHGSLYEFVRNDAFDARNFFSEEVEPLKQHQFGGTGGGPIRRDRVFLFGYYEGFRNTQGITTSATVPTSAERQGDFSALPGPLLNLAAGGVPFPGNRLPEQAINPVARNVLAMYPLGNVSPSIYRATLVGRNDHHKVGGRIDVNASTRDQLFARYAYSGGTNNNPISVRGSDAPGFPTRDDVATHALTIAATRMVTSSLTDTPTSTCRSFATCRSPLAHGSSSAPRCSTSRTTSISACRSRISIRRTSGGSSRPVPRV